MPCLTAATISAPKLLHARSSDRYGAVESILECEIDWEQAGTAASSKTLIVRSASMGSLHLRCGLALLQAPARTLQKPLAASHSAVAGLARLKASVQQHMAEGPSQKAILAGVGQPQDCAGVGSRSGFAVHPAAADASLHLGAVCVDAGPLAEAAPRTSRVPIALGAYTASLCDAHNGMLPTEAKIAIFVACNFVRHAAGNAHQELTGTCTAGAASWAVAGAAEEAEEPALAVSDAWWRPEAAAPGAGMKLQRLVAKQLAPQVCDFQP